MKRNRIKKIAIITLIAVSFLFLGGYILIDRYYKNIQAHQQAIVDDYNKNEEAKVRAKLAEEVRQGQDAQQRYETYIQKYIDYYGYTPEDSAYPVQEDGRNYYTIKEIPEDVTGLSSSDYKGFIGEVWNSYGSVENKYYSIQLDIYYSFDGEPSDSFKKEMYSKIVQYFLKPIQPDITLEQTTEFIHNSIDLVGKTDSPINNLTGMDAANNNQLRFIFYLHGQ